MSEEVAAAAVAAAHDARLPVYAHATSASEAREAVRAGVDALVHSIVEDPLDDRLLGEMKDRGVGYITTLSMFEGFIDFTGPRAPWDDPFLHRLVPASALEEAREPDFLARLEPLVRWARADLPQGRANLLRAVEGGLTVALGTDAGNPFVFPGYAIHRELEALVEAGLEPIAAIHVATLGGARLLGVQDRYGSVEPGKAADLLVLDADPTRDIGKAFRRIETVIKDGRPVALGSLPLPGNEASGGSPPSATRH